MTPIQLRSVLIDTRTRALKSRITSVTCQKSLPSYKPKRTSWKRRFGLSMILSALGAGMAVVVYGVVS